MHVPQKEHRNMLYNLCVRAVITDPGLYYDDLVDILSFNVEEGEAVAIIAKRRRRAISETDRDAVTNGKRRIARTYIDRAHRNGRITYHDRQDGVTTPRTVFLGDPPRGGGPAGRLRTWQDELRATEEVAGILDRTRAELSGEAGT